MKEFFRDDDAYTQPMGNGLLVGAALTALAAVLAARFPPARSASDSRPARVGDNHSAASKPIC